ncbi:MAG: ATP-binding protein [Candidatus Micrarchaeota archaeon]|nr:ATP-binding protein [Candidatus Micrarchaeota archaeon]
MKLSYLLSKELSRRMILVHPPEPRKDLLLAPPDDAIYLGRTRYLGTPVFWDPTKLINPHIAIVGITGSGKSYLVKSFLTRASMIWNTNAIILDWVGEYVKWVEQAGGTVIKLGKEKLNLLDLAGVEKTERIKQIISALDILLNLKQYLNERDEIEEALEEIYEKMKKPTLVDVVKHLETKKHKKAARLIKKFTIEGSDFFAGKSTLNIRELTKTGLVCLDLHELPTEEIRSLAGLTILQYIKETMRKTKVGEEKGIKLFVVLDEAWKIAQDETSDVITIVREGRKYNFALIVATQNPTDMHKTIFSNVGTMFILRLVLREFRDYVKNSIGYSEFIDQEMGKFGVGDAAINMIFAERQSRITTFLLNKIDGEEPLFQFKIKGGDMDVEIEREQFIKMLYEIGLNEGQINTLKLEFEKNDGIVEGERLVSILEKFGYSKPSIISFLRQLGIDEKNLIHIFSLVRMRKASKGVVNIVLDKKV